NQGEAPVQRKHHDDHSHQREDVNYRTQKTTGDEALDVVDVAGNSADQVASAVLVVKREREPLHVGVNGAPKIVGYPLPDAGREVLLRVSGNGIENGDGEHRDAGELHGCQLSGSEEAAHQVRHGGLVTVALEDFVQNQ